MMDDWFDLIRYMVKYNYRSVTVRTRLNSHELIAITKDGQKRRVSTNYLVIDKKKKTSKQKKGSVTI